MAGMRVVVTGATGNMGTSVVQALDGAEEVSSILGLARRASSWRTSKLELATVDVGTDDLDEHLAGADVVIHLAWLFQPTHRPDITWRTNALGSLRVFEAVARTGVPALVYGSSVGAYSPGPGEPPVTESWPTHGWPGAAYTREKSYVERLLDHFERDHPGTRVVRMRPGFCFKRTSASQQRRLFAGPFVPGQLARPELIPAVPFPQGLRMQTVHTEDIAQAYRLAAQRHVSGAFNVAAEPVIDGSTIAKLLDAKLVTVPTPVVRAAVSAAWHMHAVPASPGLFDAVMNLPIMDTDRARTELGWQPKYSSEDALTAFLTGLNEGAGMPTRPLAPHAEGGRAEEIRKGVGMRP